MKRFRFLLSGLLAGCVNGLLGTGGGLVLLPLLGKTPDLEDAEVFPACVSCMLPISILTLILTHALAAVSLQTALPYLLGSLGGGLLSLRIGLRLSPVWLHRGLGLLMLAGGIRSLC